MKSYDLAWLIHLVGDVHQPLHTTSQYTASTRHRDNGGNGVHVCLPRAQQCDAKHFGKLHGFWDGALGETRLPSSAISTAIDILNATRSPHPTVHCVTAEVSPEAWLDESFELAKTAVYAAPVGPGMGPYRLTDAYRIKALAIAHDRVCLAGARLADLLNGSFSAASSPPANDGEPAPI